MANRITCNARPELPVIQMGNGLTDVHGSSRHCCVGVGASEVRAGVCILDRIARSGGLGTWSGGIRHRRNALARRDICRGSEFFNSGDHRRGIESRLGKAGLRAEGRLADAAPDAFANAGVGIRTTRYQGKRRGDPFDLFRERPQALRNSWDHHACLRMPRLQ